MGWYVRFKDSNMVCWFKQMVYVRFKKCFFPWINSGPTQLATRFRRCVSNAEWWLYLKNPSRPSMNLAILMVTILGMKPIIFRFFMCKWCMCIQIWFHIFYVHLKFWRCWNWQFQCSNYIPPRLKASPSFRKAPPDCSRAWPRPLVWRHGPRRYAAGAVARSQSCKFLGSVIPNPWAMGRHLIDWLPMP